ncbi:hypothetical protein V7165_24055, partial [Priestia megaterium]|uniref:hypothetical protein n=1 Tax=Priestia megaterium TaxID=1404 RepID=UPI00300842FD
MYFYLLRCLLFDTQGFYYFPTLILDVKEPVILIDFLSKQSPCLLDRGISESGEMFRNELILGIIDKSK